MLVPNEKQPWDWNTTTTTTEPTVEEGRGAYLRGPMTGIPDFNFPAFHSAAKKLRALGMVIKNPADSESTADGKPNVHKMPKECGGKTNKTLAEVRHADYLMLLGCESIILLPGWYDSKGAKSEFEVARLCGMPAYTYYDDDGCIELRAVKND